MAINFKKQQNFSLFLIINVHLLKILRGNPIILFVPKVPRIIFYPQKHPSQTQKPKHEHKDNFGLGHPVYTYVD